MYAGEHLEDGRLQRSTAEGADAVQRLDDCVTVPFTDQTVIELAVWLNSPDRVSVEAIPNTPPPGRGFATPDRVTDEPIPRALAPGRGIATPEVPAVRVECASEEQWLAARLGGIGASEIPIIMGHSSFSSPYALWYRKKLDWRLPRTESMEWGHLVEGPIIELFRAERPDLFITRPVGAPYSLWADRYRPWAICTPDDLAVDRDGQVFPVEVKSYEGGPGWGESGSDEVPESVRIQAAWQAMIFESRGVLVVRRRSSGKGRLAWYWIEVDAELTQLMYRMIEAGMAFLDSLERDEPPEPDGSKSTTEVLREINPAIDAEEQATVSWELYYEWLEARECKRDAGKREALASNRLRQAMGRAEFAITHTGDTFAKRSIRKRSGYEVPPGQVDELREINSGERQAAGDVPGGPTPDPGLGNDDVVGNDGRLPADPEAAAEAGQEGSGGGAGEAGGVAVGEDPAGAAMNPDPHPDCPHEWHGADGGACPLCGWDSHPVDEGRRVAAAFAAGEVTFGGRVLTDDEIQALADKAERGDGAKLLSLGEVPHAPEGCHMGGQPHLGPCIRCVCGHEGLDRMFHLFPCPLRDASHGIDDL